MTRRVSRPAAAVLAAVLVPTGCGSAPDRSGPTGVDGLEIPTPSADPRDYVETIDNPWLPLVPGTRWVYESTGEHPETITVSVTDETRVVQGVTTTVVHDVVTGPDGEVVEDTYDWFAQDVDGNVWYFGEDGAWEAGVDGARAGVVMLAEPRVGDGYQQEYYEGEAEDRGRVLTLDEQRDVALASYDGLLLTEDTTPLEPGLVEHRYYARGVGLVYEETVEGGDDRIELVRLTRP